VYLERVVKLNPDRVPRSARNLIGLAERWGISDDYDRETAVHSATEVEWRVLATAIDETADDFWDWLVGPEADAPSPSPEYIAMTNLTMAADSAKLQLSKLTSGDIA
jgi:hypothetical protein